jgi:hypothetical protein
VKAKGNCTMTAHDGVVQIDAAFQEAVRVVAAPAVAFTNLWVDQAGILVCISWPPRTLCRRRAAPFASRQAAGSTLADAWARCGIDQPAMSRLENGRTPNPTLDTLWRHAAAPGKRLVLTAKEVPDTRGRRTNGGHAVVKKMAAREKGTACAPGRERK